MAFSPAAWWVPLACVAVLLLPGFAWQFLFWQDDKDIFERLADAIGASIAITALVVLALSLLGWKISGLGLALGYGLALLIVLAGITRCAFGRLVQRKTGQSVAAGPPPRQMARPLIESLVPWLPLILLGTSLASLVALRFYQIRELALPAWVDSVHHVTIVQAFLENRGLPRTLEPYIPVPFYYHYGFHALSAAFAALARMPAERAVLWLGQVLNVAVALAVYRLGRALWEGRKRAFVAMLLVGFGTQMPAFYATWGRYTLLTGLILLPLAVALAQDILQRGATRARLSSFVLLAGGILLTHYLAAALLALFLLCAVGLALVQSIRRANTPANGNWLPLVLAGAAGLVLASPWLFRVWEFSQAGPRLRAIAPTLEAAESFFYPGYPAYLWNLLGPRRNYIFLFLSLAGLPLAILRPQTRGFGLWCIGVGLFSLPWGLHIAPFTPDNLVIVLFLPIALLCADVFVSLASWLARGRYAGWVWAGAGLGLLAIVVWGAWETRDLIKPQTQLASAADLRAIEWIDQHLPPDARFLINVTHWQYGAYRGVDGGWWIGPLTRRETLLPPVLYTMGEKAYVRQVNDLARQTSQLRGCTPEFWNLVGSAGATHIYLGPVAGPLRPESLENCSGLERVYQEGGISIFRLTP